MGKGDRKSRRGKIWRGSYGKKRPKIQDAKRKRETLRKETISGNMNLNTSFGQAE